MNFNKIAIALAVILELVIAFTGHKERKELDAHINNVEQKLNLIFE